MGGKGSGRKDRTTELIKSMKGQQFEPRTPISNEMFLPNLSGIARHPEMAGPQGFVKKTGDTMTGELIAPEIDIIHTAEENDEHALEIDVNAVGFGDVKAIDIVYNTGTLSSGEDEEAILINIDQTSATGGDFNAMEVLATEGSLDAIHAIEVGALVGPIDQISGVFVDMDSITVAGDDKLTELKSGGAGNVTMFTADDDTVIIGDVAKFEEMEFILSTTASGAGIQPKFEFSNGVDFTEFSPADGTNAFRNTGVMLWLDADIPTWAANGGEFLIKITRQRNSLTTVPICDKVQIVKGTEFSWDKDGDVTIRDLNLRNTTSTGTSTSTTGPNESVIIGDSAGNDPQIGFVSDLTNRFTIGIDDNDDKFKISQNIDLETSTVLEIDETTGNIAIINDLDVQGAFTSLGIDDNATTEAINIDSNEIVTMVKQPSFLAQVTSSQSNVTGDNTQYAITGAIWTEIIDKNADFSNGTFTAPVTGTYLFTADLVCTGVLSTHTRFDLTFITSNRNYTMIRLNGANLRDDLDTVLANGGMIVDMDASDTITLRLIVTNGTKVVDVDSSTKWSGELLS